MKMYIEVFGVRNLKGKLQKLPIVMTCDPVVLEDFMQVLADRMQVDMEVQTRMATSDPGWLDPEQTANPEVGHVVEDAE